MFKLSIVTTLYHSAAFLPEFCRRVRDAAETITADFEIILVNDGSPDDSLDVALTRQAQDDRIQIVDLSRNFGHHKAMMTGLKHASGDLIFQIDCDLEEEPELLGEFFEQLQSTDADVIFGIQTKRKGGLFERFSGGFYWRLLSWISSVEIPANQTMMRLMTRRYVDRLIEHQDRTTFLPGLWSITGFKQVAVPIHKHSREGSTYTLRRKVAQAVDSITSFSSTPLVGIFYLGSAIVMVATTAAAILIVRKLLVEDFQAGWPSLIVSIWLLGGLTIFCLGILGIYLSKIFLEVKERPFTVVRQVYGSTDAEAGRSFEAPRQHREASPVSLHREVQTSIDQ